MIYFGKIEVSITSLDARKLSSLSLTVTSVNFTVPLPKFKDEEMNQSSEKKKKIVFSSFVYSVQQENERSDLLVSDKNLIKCINEM